MESVMNYKAACRYLVFPLFAALLFYLLPARATAAGRNSTLTSYDQEFIKNNRTGSLWTKMRSKKFNSPIEVKQYLVRLNNGQFADWRLPTRQELYELIAIFDLKDNGQIKASIEGKYWYTGDNGSMEVGAWEIGDGCGPSRKFYPASKGHVWAVRP